MLRFAARWIAALSAVCILLLSASAFAQGSRAGKGRKAKKDVVHVIGFDSEEALDQAEALSTAFRAHARTAGVFEVAESSPGLSMLTAALRCPSQPDGPCLKRIAKQIKSERFFWGTVRRSDGAHVVADIHFVQGDDPETSTSLEFSDNLNDANDDALKKMARRAFEKLTGTAKTGTVEIRTNAEQGTVFVGGSREGLVEASRCTIELPPGRHSVEVRASGRAPWSTTISVEAGEEIRLDVELKDAKVAPPPPVEEKSSGVSGRKIVGFSVIGLGVVAGVVGVLQFAKWSSLQSDVDDLRRANYGYTNTQVGDPCAPPPGGSAAAVAQAADGCKLNDDAKSASTLGWIAGGVSIVGLAAGTYLVLTDKSSKEDPKVGARSRKLRVAPMAGRGTGGLMVRFNF